MHDVTSITCEALWSFMATHREDEYVLVDVRELEEYRAGHIPGAKSYPLSDFDVRMPELCRLDSKLLIFYCRSGGRSARAATLAVRGLSLCGVHHLTGGILAWRNEVLHEPPRLSAFDASAATAELLRRALSLEKGAHIFYAELAARVPSGPAGDAARELAEDEVAHARAVYQLIAGPRASEDAFRAEFERADGRLTESGEPVAELVERASRAGLHGATALLEFALDVELRAYDLYKTLATQATGLTREMLFELAQHEKRHVAAVARRLAQASLRPARPRRVEAAAVAPP